MDTSSLCEAFVWLFQVKTRFVVAICLGKHEPSIPRTGTWGNLEAPFGRQQHLCFFVAASLYFFVVSFNIDQVGKFWTTTKKKTAHKYQSNVSWWFMFFGECCRSLEGSRAYPEVPKMLKPTTMIPSEIMINLVNQVTVAQTVQRLLQFASNFCAGLLIIPLESLEKGSILPTKTQLFSPFSAFFKKRNDQETFRKLMESYCWWKRSG